MPERPGRKAGQWTVPLLLAATAALALLAVLGLRTAHQMAWREAGEDGRALVRILAIGLARDLAAMEGELSRDARALEAQAHAAVRSGGEVGLHFGRQLAILLDQPAPHPFESPPLLVMDTDATLLGANTALAADAAGTMAALRADDVFLFELDDAGTRSVLSRPFRAAPDAAWQVAMGRRIGGPGQHGAASYALVTVRELGALTARMRAVALAPGDSLSLLRQDGIVLARFPAPDDRAGIDISREEIFRRIRAEPSAQFVAVSHVDGIRKLITAAEIPGMPLFVTATQTAAGINGRWLAVALPPALATAGMLGCLGITGVLLLRETRASGRAASALAEAVRAFQMLAEHSSDMVVRVDLDGTRSWVSPAARRLLGREPAEMEGGNVFAEAQGDAAAALRAAGARLLRGETDIELVRHALRHADGHLVPVETALRLLRDSEDRVVGWVAVNRDHTRHLEEEAALRKAAETDALTGLANRRGFETALARAWARCAAEGQPLSLVLLDLDGFKALNDAMGHPEGDAMLRRVAGALTLALRRDSDLAARLGGDEMALLLPGADTRQALGIAERVRRLVAERGGRMRDQRGARLRVSASVGVAGCVPGMDGDGSQALMQAADLALYRAKQEGRDCVRVEA